MGRRRDKRRPARSTAPHRAHPGQPGRGIPVAWEGSQFVYSSLAHVNRELCLGLIESGDVDLSILPFERHQFGAEADPRFAAIERRLTWQPRRTPAVHVRHQWPPRFDPPAAGAWVMIQPWEFGSVPAEWVAPMRDQVDEIWVPTSWVRECYIRSGIPGEKVVVIPNGVDTASYRPDGPRYPLKTKKSFKFLFVGGTIVRKGIDVLLDSYRAAFTAADDVCLVIKAVGVNTLYRGSRIEELISTIQQLPNAPAIEYLSTDLSDAEVAALYRSCDALVHPYRGEGFGMPIAEAMASGLPVIVPAYGACLDFCDETTAYLVPATEVPITNPRGLPPSAAGYWWAEPDRQALANQMRYAVTHPDEARQLGQQARRRIEELEWSVPTQLVLERLRALARRTPVRFQARRTTAGQPEPLHLEGRRGQVFLHLPNWQSPEWQTVLTGYAQAFEPCDDVTLALWLDPDQGLTAQAALERVAAALASAGLDPEATPDMLLVPDPLDQAGLARLYAAAEWVIPTAGHAAPPAFVRTLGDLSVDGWRAAAGLSAATRPTSRAA